MSKIGQYALGIQKQANELGFSTIQEALDNGYEIIEDVLTKKVDSYDALAELEKAHEEWKKKKKGVLGDLNNLMLGMSMVGKTSGNSTDYAVVERAYKFIKEDCHDR